jgi:hypothetical protein
MELSPLTFQGIVVRKQIGKGSKSERVANILMTDCGKEWVLRQQGKSALQDPELDALEGKAIKATGNVNSYVLVLSAFEEISETDLKKK